MSVNKPIRAGIVGAGLMGRWHAHALRYAGGEVLAVADSNIEAARKLADHYGAAAFDSLDALLVAHELDVLHICTPLPSHFALAEKALEAGCHVVIEKPITPDSLQTQHLYELADQHKRLVCPVYQFTTQDGALKALRMLPHIGTVLHIEGLFRSAGGAGQPESQWDHIVADILPHPLSLTYLVFGGLAPMEWLALHPDNGELHALAEKNHTVISLNISLHGRPPVAQFRITGSSGAIHLDLFHGYAFVESGVVSRADKVLRPFDYSLRKLGTAAVNLTGRALRRETAYPGLRRLITSFYAAFDGQSPPPISPEMALAVARAREAIIRQTGLSIQP